MAWLSSGRGLPAVVLQTRFRPRVATAGMTHKILVKNHEAVCAGLIAGGALTGIAVKVLETFVF